MTADDIGMEMDAISDALNRVGPSASPGLMASLNEALSQWQDFYWGELDQWPVNALAQWEQRLPELRATLAQLQRSAGTQPAPVVSAPKAPGPVTALEPLKVVGTWPLWLKVTAGGVLSLAMYKVARKLELL